MKFKITLLLLIVSLFVLFLIGCVPEELTEDELAFEAEIVAEDEGVSVEEATDLVGEAYRGRGRFTDCTDSDGGEVFELQGKVTFFKNNVLQRPRVDTCLGSSGELKEYYCRSNNKPALSTTQCENGCVDGACVVVGQPHVEPPGACSDTDGGVANEHYIAGRITNELGNVVAQDFCRVGSYNPRISDQAYEVSSCDDGVDGCELVENSCGDWRRVECPNGCADGACVAVGQPHVEPPGACSDTDGGLNYYLKGTLTISGESGYLVDACQIKTGDYSYVSTDDCTGEDCYLEEAYCDSASKSYRLFPADYYKCPNGCADGACVVLEEQIEEPTRACTDSDGPQNFGEKGTAYGRHQDNSGVAIKDWTDYCTGAEGNHVYDFTCKTNVFPSADPLDVWSDLYECPNGCENGACKASRSIGGIGPPGGPPGPPAPIN